MNAVRSGLLQQLQEQLPLERKPWALAPGASEFPEAGVLVALTDEADTRVLLGRRALHLPHHPGEIAFAGGKREVEDGSPWNTALRETEEEVGIPRARVHALGELPSLITRTGFRVYPCIAAIEAEPELVVDPSEFDSVLMPTLATFANADIFRLEKMYDGENNRMVPHYQVGDDNVWGVTAAILAMLVNVAYDAGLELKRDWKEKP